MYTLKKVKKKVNIEEIYERQGDSFCKFENEIKELASSIEDDLKNERNEWKSGFHLFVYNKVKNTWRGSQRYVWVSFAIPDPCTRAFIDNTINQVISLANRNLSDDFKEIEIDVQDNKLSGSESYLENYIYKLEHRVD